MTIERPHWTDRRLALEAALALRAARCGLRLLGFRRLIWSLGSSAQGRCDIATIERVAKAVEVCAEGRGYMCLPRAFAAAWMLRLRGMRPTLHYGVRRHKGEMQAHTWLDVAGVPVVGQNQAGGFALLASFPPNGITDDRTAAE